MAVMTATPALSGAWTYGPHMAVARGQHASVLLADGSLMVCGGLNDDSGPGPYTATAEIFDPSRMVWRSAGSMNEARFGHQALRLGSGEVLVIGGFNGHSGEDPSQTVELYDPASNGWSVTTGLPTNLYSPMGVVLEDGPALLFGALRSTLYEPGAPLLAYLYDAATRSWSSCGSLRGSRTFFSALALEGRRAMLLGGRGGDPKPMNSAVVFDVATGAAEPIAPCWSGWNPLRR